MRHIGIRESVSSAATVCMAALRSRGHRGVQWERMLAAYIIEVRVPRMAVVFFFTRACVRERLRVRTFGSLLLGITDDGRRC